MSKFDARYDSSPFPFADQTGGQQDYMLRQLVGKATGVVDTSGNQYHLIAGPQGLTINLDGPYVSPYLPEYPSNLELLNGTNPSENICACSRTYTRSPVNSATGDFWHTFNDLSIPGRGLALGFTRTYNSLTSSQDSPLGFGWTDNYNAYLMTDSSGVITVTQENGAIIAFNPTLSGGYQAPTRVLATLVKNADGTLTLTRKDQEKLTFTAPSPTTAGQLIKEIDRNGYVTTLSYSGGKLVTVTDPASRTLTLSYNPAGRIASVVDPIGRTIAFTYDASGNLTDAVDVANGVTHFAYYPGTHLMQTMTDPRSGTVTNVYDSAGRVTSQTDAMNRTTAFTYTVDSTGAQTTTITDPQNNVVQ